MRGIVYKMDHIAERALVRVMLEQDQRSSSIKRLYIPFCYIGPGDTDIEMGSIIEILQYECLRVSGGIDRNVKSSESLAEITAYSVVSLGYNQLQLVAVTSCKPNYFNVVGEAYGSSEGVISYPRKIQRLEWRNQAEHSVLIGELIWLPEFYKIFVNEDGLELFFDYKAYLDPSSKTPIGRQPLLTKIRLLSDLKTEDIKNKNIDLSAIIDSLEDTLNWTKNLDDMVFVVEMAQKLALPSLQEKAESAIVEMFKKDISKYDRMTVYTKIMQKYNLATLNTVIENYFIYIIPIIDRLRTQQIKICLEFSMEPSMEKLNKAVRDELRKSVEQFAQKWNHPLLEHLLVSCEDDDVKSLVDVILTDLYCEENKQNPIIALYFLISTKYDLMFLNFILREIIEKKLLSSDDDKEIAIILAETNWVLTINNMKNVQLSSRMHKLLSSHCLVNDLYHKKIKENVIKVKNLLSDFLRKNFMQMDHSVDNLEALLDLANKFSLSSFETEIEIFLENDFNEKKHLKYIKLAVHYDLQELKFLLKYRLRTLDLSRISLEDNLLFFCNSAKVTEFAYKPIHNL